MPTEAEIVGLLAAGKLEFPPLEVDDVRTSVPREAGSRRFETDAILALRWGESVFRFAVEIKALSTPKAIRAAVDAAGRVSRPPDLYPLILVPFLSPEQLRFLQEENVSGLDLSGNGIVTVPNQLFVYRSGAPNGFPRQTPIKNVYRRNSSVVARVLLLRPRYGAISEILEEIRRRQGRVAQSTVSKACEALDAGLIVERKRGESGRTRSIRLLQPDKLLDLLAENYEPPLVKQRFQGKCSLSSEQLRSELATWSRATNERAVLTGRSSANDYAVMAREDIQSFYCSNLTSAILWLGAGLKETARFPNTELLETSDDPAYFDVRPELIASPIQVYLELTSGDKRERETAEQLRRTILAELQT